MAYEPGLFTTFIHITLWCYAFYSMTKKIIMEKKKLIRSINYQANINTKKSEKKNPYDKIKEKFFKTRNESNEKKKKKIFFIKWHESFTVPHKAVANNPGKKK